jgi:alanine dehydrogenase
MKTAMQELIDRLDYLIGLSSETMYEFGLKVAKKEAESMLEKEKEQMVDFAFKYGDLTTRQIADSFDKEYKTNDK